MSYQRELERQRKAAEKAAQQQHIKEQQQRTEQLNQQIERRLDVLRSILDVGIKRRINFEQVINDIAVRTNAVPNLPRFLPAPIPPDPEDYKAKAPKPSLLEQLTGIGKSQRMHVLHEIQLSYQHAVQVYNDAVREYKKAKAALQHATESRKQAIQRLKRQLAARDQTLIELQCLIVLEQSPYPDGFPSKKIKLYYNAENGEIIIEYDLPTYERIIPTIKGYKYIKSRDQVQEISLTKTDERAMKALYEEIIAAITLRTIHEIFASDPSQAINSVVFNGMVDTVDKATGQDIRPCLISVHVSRAELQKLQLTRVDKIQCLKHLKAQTSPSYRELVPIQPIVDLATTDPRFVEEIDMLSKIDSRTNLLEMDPTEFEHLISNLFSKMGFNTHTTRRARDGGVDVIAFDERPIVGGKIIIQAKRYRNTVGVAAVRELYGVMRDEGATKGILVATSSFGAASRKFANNKPIELIDGNQLLFLLKEHGYKTKIEFPK